MNAYRVTNNLKGFAITMTLVTAMAGCTSVDSISQQTAKDRLSQANASFAEAKKNPKVEIYALKNLQAAEKFLNDAETARKKATSPNPMNPAQGYSRAELDSIYDEVSKLAYMADRKAKGAISYADGIEATNSKLQLGKEKAEVIVQKMKIEKKLLQQDIDSKNSALERARLDLNNATTEAERTRILADIQANEMLLAKAQSDAKALEAQQFAEAKAREAETARAELAQLMEELSQLQGQMTERGIVLTIGDVLFATGKANLTSSAQISIDKLAEFMQKYPDRKLLVEGHTDSTGGDELNLKLSGQRAESVKAALEKKGVASDRIVTMGYGKKFPIDSNDTAFGKQKNRRVEVIILNEGVTPESQFRK